MKIYFYSNFKLYPKKGIMIIMEEKKPVIKDTTSLTTKKNEPKSLSVKEKNVSLTETKKKSTSLVKKAPKKKALTSTAKKEKALKLIKESEKALTKVPKKDIAIKENSNSKSKNAKRTSKKAKASTRTKKQSSQKFTAYANEYFDLPYRYNDTIVKLLAQTPKRLFVYWDISDKDRENYMNTFGKDFFENTIPFLRIKNETHNYTFDVDINDFANSWYVNINDDNSKYSIELYRRFRQNISFTNVTADNLKNIQEVKNNTIFIVSSNKIDAPNGKVISTTYPRTIEYKNIKNNTVSYKEIKKPTSEFYKVFFKEENYSTEMNTSSSR